MITQHGLGSVLSALPTSPFNMHSISTKLALYKGNTSVSISDLQMRELRRGDMMSLGGTWSGWDLNLCHLPPVTALVCADKDSLCSSRRIWAFWSLCLIVSLTSHQGVNEFKVLAEYIPTLLDSASGQACFFLTSSMAPSLVANFCLSYLIPSTHNENPVLPRGQW